MQAYKSLCAAVTICATLVNIETDKHTDRQRFDQLISIAQPAEHKTGDFPPICSYIQLYMENNTKYAHSYYQK